MTRITSADLQRRFGWYREVATREPVTITSHGQDSLVLLSIAEYRPLKARDREALYAWELSEADLAAIARAEPPPEASTHDHELEGTIRTHDPE
jgi:prevent-host-death family protein